MPMTRSGDCLPICWRDEGSGIAALDTKAFVTKARLSSRNALPIRRRQPTSLTPREPMTRQTRHDQIGTNSSNRQASGCVQALIEILQVGLRDLDAERMDVGKDKSAPSLPKFCCFVACRLFQNAFT